MPLIYNYSNTGRLKDLIKSSAIFKSDVEIVDFEAQQGDKELGEDGYLSLESETDPSFEQPRNKLLQELDKYEQSKLKLNQTRIKITQEISDYELKTIEDLTKKLNRQGIKIIWVNNPVVEGETVARQFRLDKSYDRGSIDNLISFTDPEEFPTLFEEDIRFDWHHLNRKRAEELTKLLAKNFAKKLK